MISQPSLMQTVPAHTVVLQKAKVCEAEMPPQLSELLSPKVSEGSWEVIVSGDIYIYIVKAALLRQKNKKAAGPGRLPAEVLKNDVCISFLQNLFSCLIVPIPKSKANDP